MIEAFERLSLTSSQYYSQISTNQFSQKLINRQNLAKLNNLVLYNFKSFKGQVYVGPFLSFTSIVGPNGAGKSNILDALMFCFCNQKNKIQIYDIRQFINREGKETYQEMQNKKKFCYVEVTFLLEDGSKFSLRRTLYANQEQIFTIDGEEYSQRIYESYLLKCNINHISSNYAIWQGQIDKLLMKTPKELTAYIETISGSVFFKKDQHSKQSLLTQAEKNLQVKAQRLFKLRQQKRKIKKSNQTKIQSIAIEKQYEQVLNKMLIIKVYFLKRQLQQFEKQIAIKQKEERQKIKEINEAKLKLQQQQGRKGQMQERMDRLMFQIAELNSQLKNLDSNTTIMDIQDLKQMQATIENLRKYFSCLKEKHREKQEESTQLQSVDVNKQYLQLYSLWQKDNQSMNKDLSKRKHEYLLIEGLIQSKRNIIQQYQQKLNKAEKSHSISENIRKQLAHNIDEISVKISELKMERSKVINESQKGRQQMQRLSEKIHECNEKILQLDGIINDSVENERDRELVHRLKVVDGFKGIVEQWVKPASKKYEVCFQIMMERVLKYMLCSDELAARHIGMKLKENGQIRNVLILNNIPSRHNENKYEVVRHDIGKLGYLAIDAVQYDKSVHNFELFLKNFLGGKVICQNLDKAWQILYKDIKGIKQIYTLDGSMLTADGMVSNFGCAQQLKTKFKYLNISKNKQTVMDGIQKYQKDKTKLQDELDMLKRRFDDQSMLKHGLQLEKLQSRKQQLSQKLLFLSQNTIKKQVKMPKGIEDELQELKARQLRLEGDIKSIESAMMGNKIFKDFVQKNKINNLQSFRVVQDLGSLQNVMKMKNGLNRQRQQIQNQIKKITASLAQKQAKYQKLYQKIQSMKCNDSRENIMKNLRAKEHQSSSIRNTLSNMGNVNYQRLRFKSELPSFKTKLSLMKQKSERTIKDELRVLGLSELPGENGAALQEYLGTTLERASRRNMEQAEETLQKEKEQLENRLSMLSLQLGVTHEQNIDNLDKQISELKQQVIQQQKDIAILREQVQGIKRNRKEIFVQFVRQLQPILQQTYAILTQNRDRITGQIELFMENQAFPCDEGLYIHSMPPNKRFTYDLDQLSGGQRSIVSLALQYSIAAASKSVFVMLDEIDSFLDRLNVIRFLRLIRKSLNDKSMQFILITHKRTIFESGQSMVGVVKPVDEAHSKAISLNLQNRRQYQKLNVLKPVIQ